MQTNIVYQFDSGQIANRFLHDVNSSLTLLSTKAKLFSGSKVQVFYSYQPGQFNTTLSDLDSLAERYEGKELS